MDIDADLNGRLDVIVSAIIGSDLLGWGILDTHERAVRDLLKLAGSLIPARGAVRALAHYSNHNLEWLGDVSGFDLSALEALRPPLSHIMTGDPRLSLASEAADLFSFDFASAHQYSSTDVASVRCRSLGGRINGIVQWTRVEFDDVTHYESYPGAGAESSWTDRFCSFAPNRNAAGDGRYMHGARDRSSVAFWL